MDEEPETPWEVNEYHHETPFWLEILNPWYGFSLGGFIILAVLQMLG